MKMLLSNANAEIYKRIILLINCPRIRYMKVVFSGKNYNNCFLWINEYTGPRKQGPLISEKALSCLVRVMLYVTSNQECTNA